MREQRTILVLEDDPNLLALFGRVLTEQGLQVITGTNGVEGLHELEQPGASVDLFMLDLRMPEMDGPTFFTEARRRGYAVPTLLVSASEDLPSVARDLGVTLYLRKPFPVSALRSALSALVSDDAGERREVGA